MTTLYCIIQEATGLYFNAGAFGEEPEWFESARDADRVIRSLPGDPVDYSVGAEPFSRAEYQP